MIAYTAVLFGGIAARIIYLYNTYKGDTLYIDQFELQEYFSDDDDESNDRYDESTLNDKVYALSEMGATLFNLL